MQAARNTLVVRALRRFEPFRSRSLKSLFLRDFSALEADFSRNSGFQARNSDNCVISTAGGLA
jgi:hypothetical protein